MKKYFLDIENLPERAIIIGKKGENGARCIYFDIRKWQEELGHGDLYLEFKIGENSISKELEIHSINGKWVITDEETAQAGTGSYQLKYIAGDVVKKTPVSSVTVKECIDNVVLERDS